MNTETNKALVPVIINYHAHIKSLNEILLKVLPQPGDTVVERSIKAVQSLRQEKEIDKLMRQLSEHLSVLILHSSTSSPKTELVGHKQKIVTILPLERDPDFLDRPKLMLDVTNTLTTQNRAVLTGIGGVG